MTNILKATLTLMLLSLNSFDSVAQSNNLSGTWIINSLKSDFGKLEPGIAAPKTITVAISKDSIAVTKIFGTKESFTEVLKFNDSPVETMSDGTTFKLASVKNDKNNMCILFSWYYEMNGNEWRFDRTEKWSLSKDGKLLSIDRITTMIDKIDRVKAVYNKVKE